MPPPNRIVLAISSTAFSEMDKNHGKINQQPIAFLDSGIGGLSYLAWMKQRMPDESYIYLADRKNFPYGEKSADSVIDHVVTAVNALMTHAFPKIIVIACNTASVLALSVLRQTFPIPFVGVVPAVKPAAQNSYNKKIGVIGSNRTVQDAYTEHLIASFAKDCTVFPISAGPVIDFVESRFLTASDTEKQDAAGSALSACIEENIDTVVLGCTHFLFLEDEFKKAGGKNMQIIDSREGVVNQIIRILHDVGFAAIKSAEDILLHTGPPEVAESYSQFAARFDLKYGGTVTA